MDITGAQIQIINKAGFVQIVPLTDMLTDYFEKNKDSFTGSPGKSAFELSGFSGSVEEWIASLKGDKGDKGDVVEVVKPAEPEPEAPVFIEPVTFETIADGADLFINAALWKVQNANKSHSLQRSADGKILRFQIDKGDEWKGDAGRTPGYDRSEIYLKNTPLPFNTPVWLSFVMLIEEGEPLKYTFPTKTFFITQFKANEDEGDNAGGPCTSFTLNGSGTIQMNTSSTNEPIHKKSPVSYPRATKDIARGTWHSVVLRIVLSPTAGDIKWWVDNEKVYDGSGFGNAFNDKLGPYLKLGLYRSRMEQSTAIQLKEIGVFIGDEAWGKSGSVPFMPI